MKLRVTINDASRDLEVPDDTIEQATDFFDRMDRDMDGGWQMGPEWIEKPDRIQRCQIAADKLLAAIGSSNLDLMEMMASYILNRVPDTRELVIDADGEMLNTEVIRGRADVPRPAAPTSGAPLSRMDALEQANRDVGKVYKAGKVYRFAVFDDATGEWVESPPMDREDQAEALRTKAFESRYRYLVGEDR
jgi:hypothetical protein